MTLPIFTFLFKSMFLMLNFLFQIEILKMRDSASELAAFIQHEMPWYGEFGYLANLKDLVKSQKKMIYQFMDNIHVQSEIINFIDKERINVQKNTLSIAQYLENIKCFTWIQMILEKEPDINIEKILEVLNQYSESFKLRCVPTSTPRNSLCNSLELLKMNSLKYSEHVIDINDIYKIKDIILQLQRKGHQHFCFVNLKDPNLFDVFFDTDGVIHLESREKMIAISVDISDEDQISKIGIECGYLDFTQRHNMKMYPSKDSEYAFPYWHFNALSPTKWYNKIDFCKSEITVNNWLYELNLEGAIKIVNLETNTIYSRRYETEDFFLFLEYKICKTSHKILWRRSEMDPSNFDDYSFYEYLSIKGFLYDGVDEVDEEEENSLTINFY